MSAVVRLTRRVGLCGAVAAVVGCQTFEPVETVAIGDEVRARLTTEEAIRQSQASDEPVRTLEGKVTGATDDGIELEVVTARAQTAIENFRFHTSYSVPYAGIEQLSQRRIEPVRTGIVVSLLSVALYLILDSTVIGAGDNNGDTGPPPDAGDWIMRFRIGR